MPKDAASATPVLNQSRRSRVDTGSPHNARPEPWTFLVPISVDGLALQESVIVSEFPEDYALTVVRAYRLVLAWAEGEEALARLPEADGVGSWEEEIILAAYRDQGLWAPVVVIAGEVRDARSADSERLARACMVIGEWAFSSGRPASGLLFAEAAALASPGNARRAYLAGRMLLERGRLRESERWFRRAGHVAVAGGDTEVAALSTEALEDLTRGTEG
jgi:hypothetical protein